MFVEAGIIIDSSKNNGTPQCIDNRKTIKTSAIVKEDKIILFLQK
jgi:hypothetical protein